MIRVLYNGKSRIIKDEQSNDYAAFCHVRGVCNRGFNSKIKTPIFSAIKITSLNAFYRRFQRFSMKSRKRDEIRAMLG